MDEPHGLPQGVKVVVRGRLPRGLRSAIGRVLDSGMTSALITLPAWV